MTADRSSPPATIGTRALTRAFDKAAALRVVIPMTNNRAIIGEHTNNPAMNALAGVTVVAVFAATAGLSS